MMIRNVTRSRSMPLNGVRLERAEMKAAQSLIEPLKALPHDTLRLILEALAEEGLRLDAAQDWTGVDTEPDRREQHERVLLHCYAVNAAYEDALNRHAKARYDRIKSDGDGRPPVVADE